MSCQKSLDFAGPPGAHLSFYWTMDEGGAANKLDSTVMLPWPLVAGTLAAPGLFVNGTHFDGNIAGHGLIMIASTSVVINQAVSKGISIWFWMNVAARGTPGRDPIFFTLDTDDIAHTNLFSLNVGITDPVFTAFELTHENDTDTALVDTPNVNWALNSWHMVAATYDKVAKTINVYLDGVLSATAADAFTYPDLTVSDMGFRRSQGGIAGTEDLVVDEFGLCLNGALTPAQVIALYNGGAGMTWPSVTTVVPFP